MFFSYTTCGNVDTYLEHGLNLAEILPIFAGDLSPDFVTRPNKTPPAGPLNLMTMSRFAHSMLQSAGIPPGVIQYRGLSKATRSRYSSLYTGCVHEIALSSVDMCLADWWFTAERTLLGGYFIPVYSEAVQLLVRTERQNSFWDDVAKPFDPFSPALWALILCTLLFASMLIAFLEGGDDRDDLCEGTSCAQWARTSCKAVAASSYSTSLSFASFSVMLNPKTHGGKIFSVGLAFFLTVAGSAFTANTASFLVRNAQKAPSSDLHDALSRGQRVCYSDAMYPALIGQFPGLAGLGVSAFSVSNPKSSAKSLQDGDCDVALMTIAEVQAFWAKGELCEFSLVGGAVTHFPTGFYVHERLYTSLASAAAKKIIDGTWASMETGMKAASACPTDEGDSDEGVLTPTHMIGNIIILGFSAIVAVISHYAQDRQYLTNVVSHGIHSGSHAAVLVTNSAVSAMSSGTKTHCSKLEANQQPGDAKQSCGDACQLQVSQHCQAPSPQRLEIMNL